MEAANTAPQLRFQSKYLQVKGANLHYIEEGTGKPILFIHGVPTSSYLWRNIIPQLSSHGRCIAPDLIGMGKSDKPTIDYRVFDHIEYIAEFIEQLDLRDITLVLHGWGSVIGFALAKRFADRVSAIAFYEAYLGPIADKEYQSLPVLQLAAASHSLEQRQAAIFQESKLIDKIFHLASLRDLTEAELASYRAPFEREEDRKPIWQFIQDLPLQNGPQDVFELIQDYSQHLEQVQIPKLMLYTIPGFITTVSMIRWCRDHLPNLTLADLGHGLHFGQEYDPETFGKALSNWYRAL